MPKPATKAKTQGEIAENFRHAYDALLVSGRAFDEGYLGESARLAGVVYLMVHDHGRSSVSLLSMVNRKNIPFQNTARPLNPENLLTEMPLVMMRIAASGAGYVPRLDDGPPESRPELKFSEWWEAPVLRDKQRRELSRKNLIFALRHGEGGGHVSPHLEETFADLRRNNSAGWIAITPSGSKPVSPGPEYASVRQIAHELQRSLEKHCSDLLLRPMT